MFLEAVDGGGDGRHQCEGGVVAVREYVLERQLFDSLKKSNVRVAVNDAQHDVGIAQIGRR